ncbi:PorV/PorQ family protein, partial [bacterium]
MNFRFKIIRIISICILLSAISYAKGKGTSAGNFLKLGVDTRAIALGGAYTSIADGASAIYWNPAGLDYLGEYREVSIMYTIWVHDINYQYILYSHPLELGTMGMGIQRVGIGDIIETDEYGNELGTYEPGNTVLMMSWGLQNEDLVSLGITCKYIDAQIKNKAHTFTFDIGLRKYLFNDKVYAGLSAKNLIGGLKYHEIEDALERIYTLGLGYDISTDKLLSCDVQYDDSKEIGFGLGLEYMIYDMLKLRTGYTDKYKDTGTNGLSVGIGLNIRGFTVDYAYLPLGVLEDSHFIS